MLAPIDAQIKAHMPLVRKMVWRRLRRGGMHLEMDDDLLQAARIGVWQAIEKYDPAKGEFEPFAAEMIRYHILEEVRRHDYLSAHMRRATRRGEFKTATFIHIDDVAESELQDPVTPCDLLEGAQSRKFLALLPETWQRVITLRYDQEMDWISIGIATGQGENAAKQMCHRAQKKLRGWMLGRWRPLAKHAGRTQCAND